MQDLTLVSQFFTQFQSHLSVTASHRDPQPQSIAVTGFRHGVTRQDLLFQPADRQDYFDLGFELFCELRPVGVRETQLAQRIIDHNWRLNRLSAATQNLDIALLLEAARQQHSSDPHTHATLSEVYAYKQDFRGKHSAREGLGRVETRAARQLSIYYSELDHLQKTRLSKGPHISASAISTAHHWYAVSLADAKAPVARKALPYPEPAGEK